MEKISRSPTFGDFVTILTKRSMPDVTVARSKKIFMAIAMTREIVPDTVLLCTATVIPAEVRKGESALYSSY
jgi:hypothetical protein